MLNAILTMLLSTFDFKNNNTLSDLDLSRNEFEVAGGVAMGIAMGNLTYSMIIDKSIRVLFRHRFRTGIQYPTFTIDSRRSV